MCQHWTIEPISGVFRHMAVQQVQDGSGQDRSNVGPTSTTLGQHWTNLGWTSGVSRHMAVQQVHDGSQVCPPITSQQPASSTALCSHWGFYTVVSQSGSLWTLFLAAWFALIPVTSRRIPADGHFDQLASATHRTRIWSHSSGSCGSFAPPGCRPGFPILRGRRGTRHTVLL